MREFVCVRVWQVSVNIPNRNRTAIIPVPHNNQKYCPVMEGMPINEDVYVDHEGKRVYFCCAGCPATFQEDPEKYMEILKEMEADSDNETEPENG